MQSAHKEKVEKEGEYEWVFSPAVKKRAQRYDTYYNGQIVYVILDENVDTYARILHNTRVIEWRLKTGQMTLEEVKREYIPRPEIHKLIVAKNIDDEDYNEYGWALRNKEMDRRIDNYVKTGFL